MNQAWFGYLLSAAALVCFATATLATKKASTLMPLSLGFVVATVTNVLFSGMALAIQLAFQLEPLTWVGTAFWYFVAAGVLATYLGRWFFYESVVLFGPAKASIFQVSSPLFTAFVAWLFLGESLSPTVFIAMFMAILGLLIISTKPFERRVDSSTAALPEKPRGLMRAGFAASLMKSMLFLGLGSSFAYGTGNVLRGAAIRDWNEPVLGGLLGALSGLFMHLLFASQKRELWQRLRHADRQGVWFFTLIGAATISGQILTIGAMRFIPVSLATLVTLCTPLLVIPLSRLIYKSTEKITFNLLLGTALTLGGIFSVVLR